MEDNKPIHNEEEKSPQSIDDSQQPPPQLNEPSIVEPTPSVEPITETEILTTHNLQLTTSSNMEVHHHAHDPAAPHHKKNWKSYFWEFLMLFLAVFCGFLAEYQLEHKIERERGKQYIRSFYEDLTTDTSTFSRLITTYEIKMAAMKGRQECFDSLNRNIKSESCFWTLVFHSTDFPDLIYTDRTLQQLKNAGGLRLLKPVDADSILNYDNLLREYAKAETTSQQETQASIRNTLYSLINHQKLIGSGAGQPVSFLYGNNQELLNRYFNQLWGYTATCEDLLIALRHINKRAISLITYFKKKYNL